MNIFQERIRDKLILNLIKGSLQTKIYDGGPLFDPELMGMRQGGILSPLLCNILLSKLDQKIREWDKEVSLSQASKSHNLLSRRDSEIRDKGCLVPGGSSLINPLVTAALCRINPPALLSDKLAGREIRRENHQYPSRSLVTYVRYLDNFIILLSGTHQEALEYKEKLSLYIENILNLTPIKAHITNTRKGYKFLGHVFITPRGGVRQPVIYADIPKVLKSLFIKGFCNTQGFPVEHTGYIAKTQSETNSIMNTILNEYKE